MIETIFFVSLAITFVLILYLVYQFRQKFTALEHKCDTMFEIINNIVTELNNRNNLVHHGSLPENILYTPSIPEHDSQDYNVSELPKLIVSESDDESGDESDDEAGNDSDDESGDESDDEDENGIESDDENDVILPEEINHSQPVKIINVGIGEIDDSISPEEELSVATDEHDPDIHDGLDPNTENLIVDKLDETLENKNEIQDVSMDVYKKMNLTALKAVVIEKGYATDVSKLKKQELLKLLEPSA